MTSSGYSRPAATTSTSWPRWSTPLATTATCGGVTAPSNPTPPKRNLIAAAASSTAASTSRHPHPRPVRDSHVHPGRHRDRHKPRSDRFQSIGGPAQPTPHSGRRHPNLRGDPAMPHPLARALNAAQIHSAAYALRRNTVTGNNTCVTAHARQRARRGRTGSASPRSSGLGHNPTRPARHRNADTHSPRQPTGTRRGQDRPLPSPSVASAHPSVPRHTDGAHQQDQTRHDPDR